MRTILLVLLCVLPVGVNAAVFINEIAWMGTVSSANDEWIELYNDGSAVSVEGWLLTDSNSFDVELSGTIPGNTYAVLERTDDASAPGSAFLIYTGALPNSGGTLTLYRPDGTIADQVAGGENWESAGGDNGTKDTAQYISGGWITAPGTPGKKNAAQASKTVTPTKTEAKSVIKPSDAKSRVIELQLPDTTLSLTLIAPAITYVHQPTEFLIEPYGIAEGILDSVRFSWNFGDLGTGVGVSPTHTFAYPGTYVVIVSGEYARHSAQARHEITVLPVRFSLTQNEQGDVQINNDAPYEIDLSGYSVRGARTVVFPEQTMLLPQNTITVARERLGAADVVWLMDQQYTVVASTPNVAQLAREERKVEAVAQLQAEPAIAPPPPETSVVTTNSQFTFATTNGITVTAVTESETTSTKTQVATVNQANVPISDETLPYLGLIGLLSIGILAVYAGKIPSK